MTNIDNIKNSNNILKSNNQDGAEFKKITQRAAQSLKNENSVFTALSDSTQEYILSSVEQALNRIK